MTTKSLKQIKHDQNNGPVECGNNGNIKLGPDSFMFSSELYYKQLLALGKAAAAGKMCFNSIKLKDSSSPINCSISDKIKFSGNTPHDNETEEEGNNDDEEEEDEDTDNNNEVSN